MGKSRRGIAPVLCVLACCLVGLRPSAGRQGPPAPNIVYIVADDLGWKDVGFHGSDIKTPNIDQLAQSGARLEQFYAQPMCTPSRAALMTGRYPHRDGLQTLLIPSGGPYGLATDEGLLPQGLKEAGYKTAIVGKWHLGHADSQVLATAAWVRLPRSQARFLRHGGRLDVRTVVIHEEASRVDFFLAAHPIARSASGAAHYGPPPPTSAPCTPMARSPRSSPPPPRSRRHDRLTRVTADGRRAQSTVVAW
jgi:arylsulfatase A-like enzyme